MNEIIYLQKDRPKALTGKAFVMGVISIVLRLAAAQIIVNLLISLTGIGLLNILFYLYAIVLLIRFMRRTVEGYTYTLKQETLVLQKQLGDSTHSVIEIPIGSIRAIRPVAMGERLKLYYKQVTVIDPKCAPTLRVRAAFFASLFSAWLARTLAGRHAYRVVGCALIYEEGEKLRACVFRPDEEMRAALMEALPGVFGEDDRKQQELRDTLYAKALYRAFPTLYPYVRPLFDEEEAAWAKAEIERQKEERAQRRQEKAKLRKEKREIKSGWITGNGRKEHANRKKKKAQETGGQPEHRRRKKQG